MPTLFRHLSFHPQAVFLDFNGVIVDDEELHFLLFAEVLKNQGISLSHGEYEEKYIALDDVGCFSAAYQDHRRPFSAETIADLVNEKAHLYRQRASAEAPFFDKAPELLRALADAGTPTAIVSGALEHEIRFHLERAGLTNWPPVIVSAEHSPESKPSPAPYLEALRRLSAINGPLEPSQCLAIEDTAGGAGAASGAGLYTLCVLHTTPAEKLLEAGASLVIPSLASLWG